MHDNNRLRPRLPRRLALWLAALLCAASALAGVDVNRAGEADLDGIKGIGPVLSRRILAERAHKPFDDWGDFIARVKGIGPGAAAKLSAEGLTVNGTAYSRAAGKPTAPPAPGR
jgi:competence protein ComEA